MKIKDKHDENSVKTNDLINGAKVLVEMFNNHYISIVQKAAGLVLKFLVNSTLSKNDDKTVAKFIKHYGNHPTISKIREINIKI